MTHYHADGKVDNPRGDTMERIAAALGMTEQLLRHGSGGMNAASIIPSTKQAITRTGALGVWVDSSRSNTWAAPGILWPIAREVTH